MDDFQVYMSVLCLWGSINVCNEIVINVNQFDGKDLTIYIKSYKIDEMLWKNNEIRMKNSVCTVLYQCSVIMTLAKAEVYVSLKCISKKKSKQPDMLLFTWIYLICQIIRKNHQILIKSVLCTVLYQYASIMILAKAELYDSLKWIFRKKKHFK